MRRGQRREEGRVQSEEKQTYLGDSSVENQIPFLLGVDVWVGALFSPDCAFVHVTVFLSVNVEVDVV